MLHCPLRTQHQMHSQNHTVRVFETSTVRNRVPCHFANAVGAAFVANMEAFVGTLDKNRSLRTPSWIWLKRRFQNITPRDGSWVPCFEKHRSTQLHKGGRRPRLQRRQSTNATGTQFRHVLNFLRGSKLSFETREKPRPCRKRVLFAFGLCRNGNPTLNATDSVLFATNDFMRFAKETLSHCNADVSVVRDLCNADKSSRTKTIRMRRNTDKHT